MATRTNPPRFLQALISKVIDDRSREFFLGDLAEEYAFIAIERGRLVANAWYLGQLNAAVWTTFRKKASVTMAKTERDSKQRFLDDVRTDVKYAIRTILRRPAYTAISLGTMLETMDFGNMNVESPYSKI